MYIVDPLGLVRSWHAPVMAAVSRKSTHNTNAIAVELCQCPALKRVIFAGEQTWGHFERNIVEQLQNNTKKRVEVLNHESSALERATVPVRAAAKNFRSFFFEPRK